MALAASLLGMVPRFISVAGKTDFTGWLERVSGMARDAAKTLVEILIVQAQACRVADGTGRSSSFAGERMTTVADGAVRHWTVLDRTDNVRMAGIASV